MKTRALLTLVVVAMLTGCIETEIRQTLYLEPDGTVTWSLLVDHQSDGDPEKMAAHTLKTLEELELGDDDLTAIMVAQGALDIEVTLLRQTAPLRYLITGRFARVDDVLEVLFAETSVNWTVRREDTQAVLTFLLPDNPGDEAFHPLELVVSGGSIGDSDRVLVDSFGDLVGLQVTWPLIHEADERMPLQGTTP